MNSLKAFEATISVNYYRFSATLGVEQLEDAIDKLFRHVFRLTEEEKAFFDMPSFLESVNELGVEDSTCFQVSKSRPFTLNIKRLV